MGEVRESVSSAVLSIIVGLTESKNPRDRLLLGPLRFVNHDCEANVEFLPKGDKHEIMVRALRRINKGEEITVRYGKEYFAADNDRCLCGSCEVRSRGGWKGEGISKADTRELRRRAPDSKPLRFFQFASHQY